MTNRVWTAEKDHYTTNELLLHLRHLGWLDLIDALLAAAAWAQRSVRLLRQIIPSMSAAHKTTAPAALAPRPDSASSEING